MKAAWNDCDVMTQADLIGYDQIRQDEDMKLQAILAGAKL